MMVIIRLRIDRNCSISLTFGTYV